MAEDRGDPDDAAGPASGDDLPDAAYAAALASVPGLAPRTLRLLLADRSGRHAWEVLRHDRGAQFSVLASVAHGLDVAAIWEQQRAAGVGVTVLGEPGYPAALAADPEAPAVLFSLGDPSVLDAHHRVAIVGARAPTRYGLGVAAQLGAELAGAGTVVVSDLAPGVAAAAHEGAVAACRVGCDRPEPSGPGDAAVRPVAVVGGSVAVPTPRQHAGLWWRVARMGALLSSLPHGGEVPARGVRTANLVLAAVSEVLVVVESHSEDASLESVRAARARGVPVGAVPGSVRSPASAGTNALLAEGCFVVRDVSDVLVALGAASAGAPAHPGAGRALKGDGRGEATP